MKRTAIIGTGVAGLGCAHFLHKTRDLTLYEPNSHAGGHAHTVMITQNGRDLPVDTGFMVFNHVTYPTLTRLFNQLNVPCRPAPMSFSVHHGPSNVEFCGSSINHLFAQRKNIFKPRFWRMLLQINRFNSEAVAALEDFKVQSMTLQTYVEYRGYGRDFLEMYLIPMSAAVWSTPPSRMLEFPAITLLRFFHNHGFLGLHTQHPWFTVQGGAKAYVEKLIAPFKGAIQLNCGARLVRKSSEGVVVVDASGKTDVFEEVIFACHADEALALLANPDREESSLLGQFSYQPNVALLHTDESVMPSSKRCWASWNYRVPSERGHDTASSTIYWLNQLQAIPGPTQYFISINGESQVEPSRVLRRFIYHHPLFNLAAIKAQGSLAKLNQRSKAVFFCGSYFGHGFHEDALVSALNLCRMLTGEMLLK